MDDQATQRAFTMEEARVYLGKVSRQTMYRLIEAGDLDSFHIGVRRYFTAESLDNFINSRVQDEGAQWPEIEDMIQADLEGDTADDLL